VLDHLLLSTLLVIMALQVSDSDTPSQGQSLSQTKASNVSKGRTGQPARNRGRSTRQSTSTAVKENQDTGEAQVTNYHYCKV